MKIYCVIVTFYDQFVTQRETNLPPNMVSVGN